MNAKPGRLFEVYRLRVAVQTDRGRMMQAIPGEERIFATWHTANKEAKALSTPDRLVVSQSVLLDVDGRVVFPPENLQQTSRGKWAAIAVVMEARREAAAGVARKPEGDDQPLAAPPPPKARDRSADRGCAAVRPPVQKMLGLDPRVEARIRELRLRERRSAGG